MRDTIYAVEGDEQSVDDDDHDGVDDHGLHGMTVSTRSARCVGGRVDWDVPHTKMHDSTMHHGAYTTSTRQQSARRKSVTGARRCTTERTDGKGMHDRARTGGGHDDGRGGWARDKCDVESHHDKPAAQSRQEIDSRRSIQPAIAQNRRRSTAQPAHGIEPHAESPQVAHRVTSERSYHDTSSDAHHHVSQTT